VFQKFPVRPGVLLKDFQRQGAKLLVALDVILVFGISQAILGNGLNALGPLEPLGFIRQSLPPKSIRNE
jgi:hypothetical protein